MNIDVSKLTNLEVAATFERLLEFNPCENIRPATGEIEKIAAAEMFDRLNTGEWVVLNRLYLTRAIELLREVKQ